MTVFCFPGSLDTATGGYRYDRRIVGGSATMRPLSLPGDYPFPDARARAAAARAFEAIADRSVVIVDGLAFGVLPDLMDAHAARLGLIALVHHPLHLETGLGEADRRMLRDAERRALRAARSVVVTSESTVADVVAMGVAPGRIAVIEPGTDLAAGAADGAARAVPGGGRPFELLCVATLVPRKGHLDLIDALARVAATHGPERFRVVCVGSTERDPWHAATVRERIHEHGLAQQVVLVGELDEAALAPRYASADAFILPSYHEGYGMGLTEAIAHGLPIITTRAGAIPRTVGDGGDDCPALLVAPGDSGALARAIVELIDGPALYAHLAQCASRRRLQLPDWAGAIAGFELLAAEVAALLEPA